MIIEEWRHWFVVTGLRATSVLDNFYYVIWYLGDNYRGNGSIAASRLLHGTLHNLAGNGIDLSMYLWKYFLGKNFFREDYNTEIDMEDRDDQNEYFEEKLEIK